MEMNEAGQNCQEEPDGQIIEKTEQRCVNDSDCCRRCGQVSQKASSHFPADPLWHRLLAPRSTRQRGGVDICDTGNILHSPQDGGEVVFFVLREFLRIDAKRRLSGGQGDMRFCRRS